MNLCIRAQLALSLVASAALSGCSGDSATSAPSPPPATVTVTESTAPEVTPSVQPAAPPASPTPTSTETSSTPPVASTGTFAGYTPAAAPGVSVVDYGFSSRTSFGQRGLSAGAVLYNNGPALIHAEVTFQAIDDQDNVVASDPIDVTNVPSNSFFALASWSSSPSRKPTSLELVVDDQSDQYNQPPLRSTWTATGEILENSSGIGSASVQADVMLEGPEPTVAEWHLVFRDSAGAIVGGYSGTPSLPIRTGTARDALEMSMPPNAESLVVYLDWGFV